MSVIRLLYTTDWHMRGTSPPSRLDDYPSEIRDMILEQFELARKYGVDRILHGGDLFDSASTSDSVGRDAIQLLRMSPCPIEAIIGNHDAHENPETYVRAKIGVLEAAGVIHLLRPGDIRVVEKDGLKVQITGQEYHPEIDWRDPLLDYCVFPQGEGGSLHQRLPDSDFAVHMTHGMLVDKPFAVTRHTLIEQIAGKTAADVTLGSHYHPGFSKPIIELHGKLFINPGALARKYNERSDRTRTPTVVLLEFEKGQPVRATAIPLKSARPAVEIFPEQEDASEREKELALANFMQKVREAGPMEVVNEEQAIDVIAKRDGIDAEVRHRAIQYIARARETLAESGDQQLAYYVPPEGHYIKKIRLHNFQCYDDVEIELSPGLNGIFGENNHGKTSILRALDVCLYNARLDGIQHIVRWGQTRAYVTVTFSSGIEITREFLNVNWERNTARHRYTVVVPHMKGVQPFDEEGRCVIEGFGSSIPLEVLQAHGMPPVMLDESQSVKLHYAEQDDGTSFLLNLTGPSRAKAIGRNFGVHVLDQALKEAQYERNNLVKESHRLQSEIQKLDEELAAFAGLDAEEALLDEVQEELEAIEVLIERLERLMRLKNDRERILSEIQDCQAKLTAFADLETAEVELQETEALWQRWNQLQRLADRRQGYLTTITDCRNRLEALAHVDEADQEVSEAEEMLQHLTRLEWLHGLRKQHSDTLHAANNRLEALAHVDEADREVSEAEEMLQRLARLEWLQGMRKQHSDALDVANRQLEALKELDEAAAECQELEILAARFAALEPLARRRIALAKSVADCGQKLAVLAQIPGAEEELTEALADLQKYSALYILSEKRKMLLSQISDIQQKLELYRKNFAQIAGKFNALLRQAGKCPICYSPIDEEHLAGIVNELIGPLD